MIIGRKDKLKNYDKIYDISYYNVRNTAWNFLIKNNITTFPLDLHQIIKNNNWSVISYTKYSKLKNISIDELLEISNDGFTDVDEIGNCTIAVNEKNKEQRNRFTISHEIGHILLHKTFYSSSRLEKEANMFAARILMPMCLIHECNLNTPEKIANACNVSISAATFRLVRYNDIITRNKIYTNKYEKQLKKQLKEFCKTIKKD